MTHGAIRVGRRVELASLERALDDLAAGRGALVLVAGEAGIGKTRLADELSVIAAGRGARVMWGRAWDLGTAPAFWPWSQVLGAIVRDEDATLSAVERELLAHVVPALSGAVVPVAPPLDARHLRFGVFAVVADRLARVARQAPLVIVLDDLHAADAASWELLAFVARGLRTSPLLAIATLRDAEAREQPELRDLLAALTRDATVLRLGPLSRDEVGELVAHRAPDAGVATADAIHAASHGNPLFVDELLRMLREQPAALEGGTISAIPTTFREIVGRRLGRLDPTVREVLEAASVLTGDVTPELVAPLCPALGMEVVASHLAAAARTGMLVERGDREWALGHDLLREAIRRDIEPVRRAELHRAAGEWLAARCAIDDDATNVAHHLVAAGPSSLARAIPFVVRAAEQAAERLAPEGAMRLIERALAALPADGVDGRRAELLVALGTARIRTGQGARGKEACREAAAIAERLGDHELLARAALAYGIEVTLARVDPVLVDMLARARAALPGDAGALRSRVLARLASAMQPALDPEPPIQLARDAIAAAREQRDARVLLDVITSAMGAMMDYVDAGERAPLNLEAAQLAADLGDRARELRAHARLVFDRFELGQPALAERSIEALEHLAAALRMPQFAWLAPMCHAMDAVRTGRFDDDDRLCDEARRAAVGGDTTELERCLVFHRLGRLLAEERSAELAAFEPDARALLSAQGDGPAMQAAIASAIHARAGAVAACKAELARAREHPHLLRVPVFAAFLTEPCALAGDAPLAEQLYATLVTVKDRHLSWGRWAMITEGPVARHLGLLAGVMGRADDAVRWLHEALAKAIAVGAEPFVRRIRGELAAALASRGGANDAERATSLRAARAVDSTASLADAPDRPAGTPVAALPLAPADGFSLVREGDYWSISHGARTFRLRDSRGLQILDRLVASPDREVAATELAASAGQDAIDVGDAGELLDAEARDAYRARLEDLEDAIAQAEARNDRGQLERARRERELIARELARAVGLGGRSRRAGAALERARSAVQRRVRDAIRKIGEHDPALAAHLDWAVKTGTFCSYRPSGGRAR